MKPKTTIPRRSGRASSTALALGSCLLLAFTACGAPEDTPDTMDEPAAMEPADETGAGMAPDGEPEAGAPAETRAPDAGAPSPEAREAGAQRTIPSGTSMVFTVDETVSTGDHDVGDAFTATLQSDVTGSDGTVLIPGGTSSRWTVQEASTEGDSTALLVQFESMQVNGEWRSLPVEVVSADVQTDTAATGAESAAKVGVGAAAGALIGQILGEDTRSTLIGAGAGAAAGSAVALATRGGSASLPEGSALTVELTEPVTVTP